MKTPQKLKEVLEQFTPVYTIDGLTRQFEDIAQVVFNGHFVVNGEYEIYPIDIEFYFHDEENGIIVEPQMYHKGDLPYFPVGSIYPHSSGVDMTFEREGKYRASFLMRGYTYKSVSGEKEEYTNKTNNKKSPFRSQYLWEDLLGNASVFGRGLNIVWVDNAEFKKVNIASSARVNVNKISGENGDRMWHFINLDMIK